MPGPIKLFFDFCSFCRAILFQLSNIFIGGAFGIFWACYSQITGEALPMNVFIWLAIILFVCACFGAWREQFSDVETNKAKRPDFQYSPDGNEITPRYVSAHPVIPTPATGLNIKFRLRFVNRGDATACDVDGTIYGCWIGDDPPQVFDDRGQSVGKTNPGSVFIVTSPPTIR